MPETRDQKLCIAALAFLGVYSLATLPLVPTLLGTNPVLLEALRGSTSSMITGGAFAEDGRAPLALAYLAPLLTLAVRPPIFWWAGRQFGRDVAQMLVGPARAAKWQARLKRIDEKWADLIVVAAYVLPVPSALIWAGAGWEGMRLRRFVLLDLLGTSVYIGICMTLGYLVGPPVVKVAEGIARYGLILSLVLVVVAVVIGARRGRRMPPAGDASAP